MSGIDSPDIPSAIKAKITQFQDAVKQHAFKGTMMAEDHQEMKLEAQHASW